MQADLPSRHFILMPDKQPLTITLTGLPQYRITLPLLTIHKLSQGVLLRKVVVSGLVQTD